MEGFDGFNGKYGSIFDPHVAYSFGITVTIGLMSGPVGDQQHWQRAFAFEDGKAFKGYLCGVMLRGKLLGGMLLGLFVIRKMRVG